MPSPLVEKKIWKQRKVENSIPNNADAQPSFKWIGLDRQFNINIGNKSEYLLNFFV